MILLILGQLYDDDADDDDDEDFIIDNDHAFLFNPVRHHVLANTTRAHSSISSAIYFVCIIKPLADRGVNG